MIMPLLHKPSSLLLLLLFLLHLLRSTSAASHPHPPPPPPPSTASPPPPPPTEPPCSDDLEEFSVCLPYISATPIDTPPLECCTAFASAFSYNHSACLCYLVRQNLVLGFTINSSRFFSLPSLCTLVDARFSVNNSDASLCPGSPVLPPLHTMTGPQHGPLKSHEEQQSHAHMTDPSIEPDSRMPTSSSSPTTVLMTSKCRWVPLSVIFFFTCIVVL